MSKRSLKTQGNKRNAGQLDKVKEKIPYPQIQLRGDNVVEVDLKENKVEYKVCSKIEIGKILYNIDTKVKGIVLDFKYYGKNHSIEIDRSYFDKRKLITLQKYGVGVYDFNANNVIKHLVNQEVFAKRIYNHSLVGMVKDEEGKYTFRHYKAKVGELISIYSGNLKLKPKGTKNGNENITRLCARENSSRSNNSNSF